MNGTTAIHAFRDQMRRLIHRRHCHPMRHIVRKSVAAIQLPYNVGERAAPRHDQQPAIPGTDANRLDHGVEKRWKRQQAAANLHDCRKRFDMSDPVWITGETPRRLRRPLCADPDT